MPKYNVVGLMVMLGLAATCWGQAPCASQQGLPGEIALKDTAVHVEPLVVDAPVQSVPRVLSDNAQAERVLMNLLNRTDLTKKETDSLNALLRGIVLHPSAPGFYLPELLLIRNAADRRLLKKHK